MLALKRENKSLVRNIFVRFFSYGVSEKGRGGVFVSWEDQEKYREYFSVDYLHDPDIRVCGYVHNRDGRYPKN